MAKAWALASRPQGMPAEANFELIDLPQRALADGEVRIANRWLSVDPYMRGRMNDVKSYVPPYALGEPMQGGAVGEVIESRADGIVAGDRVLHMEGRSEEHTSELQSLMRISYAVFCLKKKKRKPTDERRNRQT